MKRLALTAVLAAFSPLAAPAALSIMPLREVHAGLHGIGKTVFSGDKVEDFDVEILGILENTGPKESLILARLSGGPLEHTGVMQGMSGSPVYIDGRLIGAVAMAFPFAKDPIAGIRPIEEMLAVDNLPDARRVQPRRDIASLLPTPEAPVAHEGRDDRGRDADFARRVYTRGSRPVRAGAALPGTGTSSEPVLGGGPKTKMGDPSKLKPGSMISVELMTGDMSVGADGTLTCIDGDRVYAFGHRFLAVGPTDLPFTRSEVMTLLANVNTSFKISSSRELMGVISQDRNTAITGSLGAQARMLPLDITVAQQAGGAFAMSTLSHADGERPFSVAVPAADGAFSRPSMRPSGRPARPA